MAEQAVSVAEKEAELAALQANFDDYIESSRLLEEELEDELKQAQSKVSTLQIQNKNLSRNTANAQNQISTLESTIATLRDQLSAESCARREAEHVADDAETRARTSEGSLDVLRDENDRLAESLAFKDEELDGVRGDWERTREELREAREEIGVLKARVGDEMGRNDVVMGDETTERQQQQTQQQEYIETLEDEFETVNKELTECRRNLDDMEHQWRTSEEEKRQYEDRAMCAERIIDDSYDSGINITISKSVECDEDVIMKEHSIVPDHDERDHIPMLEENYRALKQECNNLKEELDSLHEELTQSQEKLSRTDEIERNARHWEEEVRSNRSAMVKLNEELEEALSEVSVVKSRTLTLEDEVEELKRSHGQLEAERSILEENMKRLEEQGMMQGGETQQLRNELRKSVGECTALMKENMKSLEERGEVFGGETQQLRSELRRSVEDCLGLKDRLDKVESLRQHEVSSLQQQLEMIQTKYNEAHYQITTLQEALEAEQRKNRKSSTNVSSAPQQIESLRESLLKSKQISCARLDEIKKLKKTFNETSNDKDELIELLQENVSDLQDEVSVLRRHQEEQKDDNGTTAMDFELTKSPSKVTDLPPRQHPSTKKPDIVASLRAQLAQSKTQQSQAALQLRSSQRQLQTSQRQLEVSQRQLEDTQAELSQTLKLLAETKARVTLSIGSSVNTSSNVCKPHVPSVRKRKRVVGDNDNDEHCHLQEKLTRQQMHNAQLLSRLLHLSGKIQVCCRIRPGAEDEDCFVEALSDTDVGVLDKKTQVWKSFSFDKVWDEDVGQDEVWRDVEPLCQSVVEGYDAAILAYGQTGSGKTYTMEGTTDNHGISFRTVNKLFELLETKKDSDGHSISISMLEIYNDDVYDLLSPAQTGNNVIGNKRKPLDIKRATDNTIKVPDLHSHTIKNAEEVNALMATANANRATASTNLNAHSSRSHMVLTITITTPTTCSSLSLVDLAGSERILKSKVLGAQLKEAQHINKSLSALGDVMEALDQKASHIPYRNSKLTYLLQNCLGGNARTLMVVTVNPACDDESHCALQFAKRARRVTAPTATKKVVEKNNEKQIKALTAEIKAITKAKDAKDQQLLTLKRDYDDESHCALQFAKRARRVTVVEKNNEQQIKALTAEIKAITKAKDAKDQQLLTLKRDYARLMERINVCEKNAKKNATDASVDKLKKEIEDILGKYEKEKGLREEKCVDLEHCQKELKRLQQQLLRANKDRDGLTKKHLVLEGELAALRKELKNAKEAQRQDNLENRQHKQTSLPDPPAPPPSSLRAAAIASASMRTPSKRYTMDTKLPSVKSTRSPQLSLPSSSTDTNSSSNDESSFTMTTASTTVNTTRDRITSLLTKYEPHRIQRLDLLFEKYLGREDLLLQKITERYEKKEEQGDTSGSSVGVNGSPKTRMEMAMKRHTERMKKIRSERISNIAQAEK
eukprot:CAMPEP_0172519254 /NCGR_PEP_ID=MMETSP1066-20121228/291306_1 /TAXON_ID=671091 /ORGANISM="Coscinodiscus wailesii, Strain CCMP2513" /LENGTH=1443 /DNA_ID=CAMNT_0013301807 /DNA_START=226 /DNA_END=4557 /DNA_ORIENTATION=+